MEKLIVFILSVLLFVSCRDSNIESNTTDYKIKSYYQPVKILTIDGCEYLFGDWGYSTVLTHKGNCKQCSEERLINKQKLK